MSFSNTTIPLALSILFIAGLALGASKPPVSGEEDTITVSLDLVGGESERPVRVALAIAGFGCSELSDHRAEADHKLKICRVRSDSDAPQLSFSIERHTGHGQRSVRSFKVAAAVPLDKTIVIGRYDDNAAPPLEVRARTAR